MSNESLLMDTLIVAVPLWVEKFRSYPMEDILVIAKSCSQVIAEKGDVILFKSKKKGESARAFNALARALACLAFMPGGVRFNGVKWEYKDDVLTCTSCYEVENVQSE